MSCQYLVKERQFCQNYDILWALYYGPKKIIGCPFVSNFSRKNHCSHAHILLKKLHFSKKHTALMPIFCQKNVHSLKKHCALMSFFSNFHDKPSALMPIFGQKNVNSVKSTLYYGPNKSIGCHSFPILYEKITALMPICCQKTFIL